MIEKAETTRFERVMGAVDHKETDRVPVVANNILPGIKYAGYKVSECFADADKFVRSQVKCLELGFDAAWAQEGIDDLTLAVGAQAKVEEDSFPMMRDHPIKTREDIPRIRAVDPLTHEPARNRIEALRRLKQAVGKDVPVFAIMRAPFNTACMWAGVEHMYKSMITDQAFVTELVEVATQKIVEHALATVEAGADIVWMGNSVASGLSISRKHYQRFVHPSTTRAFGELKARGVRTALHTCGDWNDRFDLVIDEGADIWHVSDYADLATLKQLYGDRVCLLGNVRAIGFLTGTPEEIREEAKKCMQNAGRGGGLLLGADCSVPRDVPLENLRALVEADRTYGQYPLAF